MHVRLAVLADAANQSADGKLNVLGEFNLISAAAFPVVWPRMFMVLKLEALVDEGAKHRMLLRLVDEDAKPMGTPIEGEIDLGQKFRAGVPLSASLIIEFQNMRFDRAGTYEFEIFISNKRIATVPLYVFPREAGAREQ
jgi:hypothetical protein